MAVLRGLALTLTIGISGMTSRLLVKSARPMSMAMAMSMATDTSEADRDLMLLALPRCAKALHLRRWQTLPFLLRPVLLLAKRGLRLVRPPTKGKDDWDDKLVDYLPYMLV